MGDREQAGPQFGAGAAPALRPTRLVAIAVAGQACAWLLAILASRSLTVDGFAAYAVASAIFILLATLTPLGSEKLALRLLPAMLANGDRAGALAYLRFAAGRTLRTALLAAGLAAIAALILADGETRAAILVTCGALPAGALVHVGVEVLTAAGQPHRAMLLFRLVVPLVALLVAGLLLLVPAPRPGALLVAAWGVGWVVALGLMRRAGQRQLQAPWQRAPVVAADARRWRAGGWPFLVYRLALALLAQAPLLALGVLAGPGQVGAYAAAAATVALLAVLATSTNRAYGRALSIGLDRGDTALLEATRRARRVWLAPLLLGGLAVLLAVPEALLGLFRAEFAAAGAMPLRILVLATAFTVLFAPAPTALKFRQRNRLIYVLLAAAAGGQLLLLRVLVPPLGATGAALAYLLSVGGLYAAFAAAAHREMQAPAATG